MTIPHVCFMHIKPSVINKMNKSTPINQLPNAMQQTNTFVNDQQKQMITNAQQAINNIAMPQNTQMPQDIVNDDDATIQEVLNQINSSSSHQQAPPSMQHMAQMQQVPQQMPPTQPSVPSQQLPQSILDISSMGASLSSRDMGYGSQQAMDSYMMQNIINQAQTGGAPVGPIMPQSSSTIDIFVHMFADDIKLALLVFIVAVTAHFIPLGSLLGRYIALDKIPYHDLLLKALVVAVLVILLKKIAKI